ncbi:hypothetical protein X777_08777 [Ooceraea biroi]|uniref:Uncharacterized protein n=1 Tax=Ooceraea biroi TaxID=2015173 RepID=A0A026WBF8_OOCBI|nr:hypothetical protein X777_08777 [Ooceraea biroi]
MLSYKKNRTHTIESRESTSRNTVFLGIRVYVPVRIACTATSLPDENSTQNPEFYIPTINLFVSRTSATKVSPLDGGRKVGMFTGNGYTGYYSGDTRHEKAIARYLRGIPRAFALFKSAKLT